MQRSSRRLLAIAAVGGALGTGGVAATASASSAAAPTHGTLHVWVTPGKGSNAGRVVLTGLIADHGAGTHTSKNAVTLKLSRGTFVVDTTAFNQALNQIKPKVDQASCSVWGTGSGNVTLGGGTGAYAGIAGTLRLSVTFAAIVPRATSGPKKGQCKVNAKPTAQWESSITGVGHVTL